MNTINLWAVLVSGLASMVIGSIWYGPLYGKKYMSAVGMDAWSPEKREAMRKSMGPSYAGQFVASLLSFFVLAWLMGALNMQSVLGGIETGFGIWLGFIVPLKLGDTLWGGNKTLFWLSIGGNLITLLAVGAIIGAWK